MHVLSGILFHQHHLRRIACTVPGYARRYKEFVLAKISVQLAVSVRSNLLPFRNSRTFSSISVESSQLADIIRGKPIVGVSTALSVLDTLQLCSGSIRRLSIVSADATQPDILAEEIARRFPKLEALHFVLASRPSVVSTLFFIIIIIIIGSPISKSLADFSPSLSTFESLRYILLPQGSIWLKVDGSWACMTEGG